MMKHILKLTVVTVFGIAVLSVPSVFAAEENGSIGLEGRINSAPPTQGATISFPRDGAVINDLPVTVTGICPNGLLVKLFKNNVFAGATQCNNGSFSIQIDLFSGRNELIARVYDDLDQAGPDSNMVAVTFPFTGFTTGTRISLTSSFAKRGANPGQRLTWPITLSGGNGPYAISVDWGDGKTPDIISQQFPGTFNIEHIYDNAGVYNVVVRATDKDGNVAFLQLVGVANGPVSQNNGQAQNNDNAGGGQVIKILWQPALISIPLIVSTFWLGKRYELHVLRKRLEQREDIS
jgi:hypothetical protein